jgi:hypothetical protein
MKVAIFLSLLIIIVLSIWLIPILKKLQRKRIAAQPFPAEWTNIIERYLPIYGNLPGSIKSRLHCHINVFLKEKQFLGCNGLVINDEIKVTIASLACLLLLNERGEYYPNLCSILVYPSSFSVKTIKPLGSFFVEESQEVRLGESWSKGIVVLSWDQIQQDSYSWYAGHNVILHEFAHQLDQEDGIANGVPILETQADYRRWAEVFTKEYHQLSRDLEWGLPTVIDVYGATEPAEFFAVVTETFFTKPQQMKRGHPELYDELQRYYRLDPSEWTWECQSRLN